jgi:hypothetical protein
MLKIKGNFKYGANFIFLNKKGRIKHPQTYTEFNPKKLLTNSLMIWEYQNDISPELPFTISCLINDNKLIGSIASCKIFYNLNEDEGILLFLQQKLGFRNSPKNFIKKDLLLLNKWKNKGLHIGGELVNVSVQATLENLLTNKTHKISGSYKGILMKRIHYPVPIFDTQNKQHVTYIQKIYNYMKKISKCPKKKRFILKQTSYGHYKSMIFGTKEVYGLKFTENNPKYTVNGYLEFCNSVKLKGHKHNLRLGNVLYCTKRKKWFLVDPR